LQVCHQGRFISHHIWFPGLRTSIIVLKMMSYHMATVGKMADMCFVWVFTGLGRGLLAAAHARMRAG
jgi:hypothetical protein